MQVGVHSAVPVCFIHFKKVCMWAYGGIAYQDVYIAKGA